MFGPGVSTMPSETRANASNVVMWGMTDLIEASCTSTGCGNETPEGPAGGSARSPAGQSEPERDAEQHQGQATANGTASGGRRDRALQAPGEQEDTGMNRRGNADIDRAQQQRLRHHRAAVDLDE